MDQLIEEVPAVSGPLKKYKVTRGGVETVMKLSDADAERLGVGTEDVVGAASTIQPVQPVQEGEADDGPADDGAGITTAPGADGDGLGAQQVQQAEDASGDSQAPSPTPAAPDAQQQTAPAAAPEAVKKTVAKKTTAKRQPTAANKARTAADNKAADGGS
ncbi:hypothetical protein ACFXPN_20145 [Streptomyces griseorubiginosus]|uniref:hypothetical protein n=1 Tax=Streptomyces griseorubiginosus TaxID=67304 RepID=UPI0036933378